MLALAIDTSQRRGSAALARDGEVLSETAFGEERSHLRDLGVAVDGMLSAHGLAVNDVDRVALVSGPGSFTGVRIGMAFVKGLHAGLGIEVVTMGTLALLALPLFETHDSVCTMLDAHKGEVYAAVFARNVGDRVPMATADVVVPPCAMTAERFLERLRSTPAVFTGSGVARYRAVIEPAVARAHRAPSGTSYQGTDPIAGAGLRSRQRSRAQAPQGRSAVVDVIALEPMQNEHVRDVVAIEEQLFDNPWTEGMFRQEVTDGYLSRSRVALLEGHVVGYTVSWFLRDEVHLLNIAVAREHQGRGYARRMLVWLIGEAERCGRGTITLEVRESNVAARSLYEAQGFVVTGRRQNYYHDNREDAVVMTLRLREDGM
jgi:ribosomal-protein-alanine N-acetyltransferase